MSSNDRRVIVALDFPNPTQAFDLLDRIDPGQCRVKIGKEMFTRAGPAFVEQVAGIFQTGHEFVHVQYHAFERGPFPTQRLRQLEEEQKKLSQKSVEEARSIKRLEEEKQRLAEEKRKREEAERKKRELAEALAARDSQVEAAARKSGQSSAGNQKRDGTGTGGAGRMSSGGGGTEYNKYIAMIRSKVTRNWRRPGVLKSIPSVSVLIRWYATVSLVPGGSTRRRNGTRKP